MRVHTHSHSAHGLTQQRRLFRLQLSNDVIVSHTLDKSIRKIILCLVKSIYLYLLYGFPIYFHLFLFMSILSILNFALNSADCPIINISPVEMSQNNASQ